MLAVTVCTTDEVPGSPEPALHSRTASPRAAKGGMANLNDKIDAFVRRADIGWSYDPFRELNANADPHLLEYLVLDASEAEQLWQPRHTTVIGAAGAGKSSRAAALVRDCRTQWEGRRRIAVAPVLADPWRSLRNDGFPDVFGPLFQAAAAALLLQIAYRPDSFAARSGEIHHRTASLLRRDLPFNYQHCLSLLRSKEGFERLCRLVDGTSAPMPAPPSSDSLRKLSHILQTCESTNHQQSEPLGRWREYLELMVGGLGFEAVYVLLDGFDDEPLFRDGGAIRRFLRPLVQPPDFWQGHPVFLKVFLQPDVGRSALLGAASSLTDDMDFVIITWTRSTLVRVLERRILAASRNISNSFNTVSTPGLRRAEVEIVKHLPDDRLVPLDAVQIAEHLLAEYVLSGRSGALEPQDLDRALARYSAKGRRVAC